MKGDLEDLKNLAEDLQGVLQRHPDAVRYNHDLADDIVKVRDKAFDRYHQIAEDDEKPLAHYPV